MRRDFVANLTAELRTPIGALGLLADAFVGEEDPAVARRLATRVQGEAMRVGRIVDDLVALSRVEAEEAPEREPQPVHLVIADGVDRVRSTAQRRGVEIEVSEAARSLAVVGDRRQLASAVQSLVENAVAHSPAGSVVQVGAWSDGEWVDLAVRDRGVGIPARELDRIFERFYRVRDRAEGVSREGHQVMAAGAGVGLAIVRHVAAAHGGDVRVSSEEGVGSTFTLRLPAGPGPVAVSEPEAS
jgi:two-component system sensor histidine kinase SenX3